MIHIGISDRTLCQKETVFSFKEKLEIARYLENLNVEGIELPEIENAKEDYLLIRTMASFVKESRISVSSGMTDEKAGEAIDILKDIPKGMLRIELPVSPAGMEYICRKKGSAVIDWLAKTADAAAEKGVAVEFCALDATRAEPEFLKEIIERAIRHGAKRITIADDAAEILPDTFAEFIRKIKNEIICPKTSDGNIPAIAEAGEASSAEQAFYDKEPIVFGISSSNINGLACAKAIMAAKAGAQIVKTSAVGNDVPLETFAGIIKNSGNTNGICSDIKYTELNRIIKQIDWVSDNRKEEKSILPKFSLPDADISLDKSADKTEVSKCVKKLGYDLSIEDTDFVFEAFQNVSGKKNVGAKELDAIIASVALQVPQTYRLESYVSNSGNIIQSSAQLTLEKDGRGLSGVMIGDGPIDAAFKAIEQITGHHYELDDFQIQSVTEGKEAMGQAIVKLRNEGRLYSGRGISTDIIGASIQAYISAVNKILYDISR